MLVGETESVSSRDEKAQQARLQQAIRFLQQGTKRRTMMVIRGSRPRIGAIRTKAHIMFVITALELLLLAIREK